MSNINEVSNLQSTYAQQAIQKKETADQSKEIEVDDKQPAAIYEKSDSEEEDSKIYKADMEKVMAMKEETDRRLIELFQNTVKEGALKQVSGLRAFISNLKGSLTFNQIDEDNLEITDRTIQKAKDDTSKDGYWGAEATSDRFLEFAQALSGNNPDKADMLLDAVKEGYKLAEEIWGDKLPQLSQDTLELTISKFEAWRDGES